MPTTSHPATVLIVEDDPEALAADRRALEETYATLTATCGEDALRLARRARPTVILLDVMLPGGKDGFTVFGELHNDPLTRDIPVIFLTAVNRATHLTFGPREIGRHLGAEPAAFLEKPVTPKQLLLAVADAVGSRAVPPRTGRRRDRPVTPGPQEAGGPGGV